MDHNKIREAAKAFDDLLQKYGAVDQEAKFLYNTMIGLISNALLGKITEPLELRHVPGARAFDEGMLRRFRGLEEAYTNFVVEITDGEDSVIRQVTRQLEARKQTAIR